MWRRPWLMLLFLASLASTACGRIGFVRDGDARIADAAMDVPSDVRSDVPAPGAICGDGVVDGVEVCDDGNTESGDGCTALCDAREICGDGVVAGEECDDGNGENGDGCDNDCTYSCRASPDCDDGLFCNGVETCSADNACAPGPPLGDGTPCSDADSCRGGSCAPASCGNGAVDAGEECDDDNLVDGDGCDNDCTFTCVAALDCDDENDCTRDGCGGSNVCLPPLVAPDGDACERDGDPATIDVCLAGACRRSICGDDYVDMSLGEECDDGNTVNGDGCDNDCTFTCEANADCADTEICNGNETCALSTHLCRRGTPPAEGTACGEGGVCGGGVCLMISDGGVFDSGVSDSGTCPTPPTIDMPLSCFKACILDVDCVSASSSCCCGCSMGGTVEAINGATSLLWSSREAARCGSCFDISCLAIYVCPPAPTCVRGQCTATSADGGLPAS